MGRELNHPMEYLRQLELEELPQPYRPRRKYTARDLADLIRRDRQRYREQGQEWTNWRPFYSVEESENPNRCMFWRPGIPDPDCTVIGTYVAYHTTKAERLVICSGHFEREVEQWEQRRKEDNEAE